MKFDVYNPIRTKEGSIRPGVKPIHTEWATIKRYMASKANTDLIDRFRETGERNGRILGTWEQTGKLAARDKLAMAGVDCPWG